MGSQRVYGGVGFWELEGIRVCEHGTVKKNKFPIPRDGMSDVADSRRGLWGYGSSASYMRQGSHCRSIKVESVTEHSNFIKGSMIGLVSSRSDDFRVSSKCKKLSKNGNGCCKRPRLAFMDDSNCLDQSQLTKSRENCGGKRSDKRSAKVSNRTKYDLFSPKNGTEIISSSGGHNVCGYYGLKPELHDITKQVNELPLTEHSLAELLDDTFSCQDIGKNKGNTTLDTNEKNVESIKNVGSILAQQRPSQIKASTKLEGNLNKVMKTGISPVDCAPGSSRHDKRDSTVIDPFPQNTESCSCPESHANTMDLPLYHPSVVLERLGLQSPEDFESLLSGDVRPVLSARGGFDSRLGKRLATQLYLPAFSWSHKFGGNCKSTSDALKLSTSRSSCQGSKWSKMGNTACFRGVTSSDFTDFAKISFNPNLVPGGDIVSVNIGSGEPVHSPDKTLATPDTRIANVTLDENPSSVNAVAQTLCDLATLSLPPDLIQILRRPRKLHDKAPKAQKFKYEDRTERLFSRPKSLLGYDCMARHRDLSTPSKKKKITAIDKK